MIMTRGLNLHVLSLSYYTVCVINRQCRVVLSKLFEAFLFFFPLILISKQNKCNVMYVSIFYIYFSKHKSFDIVNNFNY